VTGMLNTGIRTEGDFALSLLGEYGIGRPGSVLRKVGCVGSKEVDGYGRNSEDSGSGLGVENSAWGWMIHGSSEPSSASVEEYGLRRLLFLRPRPSRRLVVQLELVKTEMVMVFKFSLATALQLSHSSFSLSFIFCSLSYFFAIFCLDCPLEIITVTIEIIFLH
jgi:hypothetical protein